MAKTIILDDIEIVAWRADPVQQNVIAIYYVLESDGSRHGTQKQATFWKTIPDPGTDPEGDPLPLPADWKQLPPEHAPMLGTVTADFRTALLAEINEP